MSTRRTPIARRAALVALLTALVGAACSSSSSSSSSSDEGPTPLNPMKGQRYLFSYFKGNGEDGLHLAYSEDGLAWRALNEDRPYFHPTVGKEKLTRDPSIVRGPDGMYHMVWTAGWNEQGFGYAESRDLITWTHERYVPVMSHEPTAFSCAEKEPLDCCVIAVAPVVWPEQPAATTPAATASTSAQSDRACCKPRSTLPEPTKPRQGLAPAPSTALQIVTYTGGQKRRESPAGAIPGSPRSTSTRLCPARIRQQPIPRLAFSPAPAARMARAAGMTDQDERQAVTPR